MKNKEMPKLAEGETYVGCIGDALGNLHHVILLPGQADDITWEKAMEWAGKQRGEYVASLPTRIEQALLLANHSDQFKKDWYWSNEISDTESSWAWYQHFGHGLQNDGRKSYELRARAVRRVNISKEKR